MVNVQKQSCEWNITMRVCDGCVYAQWIVMIPLINTSKYFVVCVRECAGIYLYSYSLCGHVINLNVEDIYCVSDINLATRGLHDAERFFFFFFESIVYFHLFSIHRCRIADKAILIFSLSISFFCLCKAAT